MPKFCHMRVLATLALLLAAGAPLAAQTPVTVPPIDFSGVLLGNYQYRTDAGAKDFNKFDVERVYLTFRMPAGDRTSIRATTDIYQQQTPGSDAYYRGWTVRFKYAYLQYNYLKRGDLSAVARLGMLHTVVIDHEEQFWPRWISQTGVERAGFFSSSDVGAATAITLPQHWGEIYGAVTNGPGYTSRETDRFKDAQLRVTLTPFNNGTSHWLTTFAISPWVYRGATASRFVNGGAGQVGPVGEGLMRDRWGILAGIRDPRLTVAVHYASKSEGGEIGNNTPASPRQVVDTTGTLLSSYVIARPFALLDSASRSPIGLVLRYDRVTPNKDVAARYHLLIGGVTYDLSKRASLSLDYQEQLSNEPFRIGGAAVPAVAPVKQLFMHFVANF